LKPLPERFLKTPPVKYGKKKRPIPVIEEYDEMFPDNIPKDKRKLFDMKTRE
jgi:hypothetical protein